MSDALPHTCFKAIVEQLNVPVLVFADRQIVYKNQAADRLFTRLRARYGVEPSVILRDQLAGFDAVLSSALTRHRAPDNRPRRAAIAKAPQPDLRKVGS